MSIMKYSIAATIVCFITTNLFAQNLKSAFSTAGFYKLDESSVREVFSFNNGWYFYKGDVANAQVMNFKQGNSWQQVQVPHSVDMLPEEASGGISYQGIVWYRKRFTLPSTTFNKKVSLHFEAIMGKCEIWLNGKLIKEHKGGYLPVIVDIPDSSLNKKKDNLIAVMADNSDDKSYPPGKSEQTLDFSYFGGIYRDVWLIATNPVYITNANSANKIAGGGVFVHYENVNKQQATVKVATDIANETNTAQQVLIETYLKDVNNNMVASTVKEVSLSANNSQSIEQTLQVSNPSLWHPDTPEQYKLVSIVKNRNNHIIDGYYQYIGIRSIEFKGKDGFFLNGEAFGDKLIGANHHQDFAYIGNAMPNNLHWRDAKKLRDAGIRIVRAAHYPHDPAFMEACNQLGIFVIVPTPGWQFWNKEAAFANYIYDDVKQMIRRDRNHPSVIMWEPIPNETHYPADFAEKVYKVTHEEYPFAGCYAACDHRSPKAELFDVLYAHPVEVTGKTLRQSTLTREWGDNVDNWDAQNSPSRVARSWGETPQLVQAIHYANPEYKVPVTNWESLYQTTAQHIGGCLWHFFDTQRGYHPDPFYGGIMDAFRQPKYSYELFRSQQNPTSAYLKTNTSNPYTLFIANDMTPFSPADVTVFTNCDSVQLIINEKVSMVQKPVPTASMPHPVLTFKKVYDFMDIKALDRGGKSAKGKLEARGFANGEVVITTIKRPAKRPSRLKLEVDMAGYQAQADGSTIIPVIASILDEKGDIKRWSNEVVRFWIEGEGEIIGNETMVADSRKMEWGTAPVLIRTTLKAGKIKLRVQPAFMGTNKPLPDTLEINTVAPTISSIYNKTDVIASTRASKVNNHVPAKKQLSLEERKRLLKQVAKDQESFEGKTKKN